MKSSSREVLDFPALKMCRYNGMMKLTLQLLGKLGLVGSRRGRKRARLVSDRTLLNAADIKKVFG